MMTTFQLTILCNLIIDSLYYEGTGTDHVRAAIDMVRHATGGKPLFKQVAYERNLGRDWYAAKYLVEDLLK